MSSSRSSQKIKGSFQCASLSSTKGSRKYTESDEARKERIDRQLRGLKVGDMICIYREAFMHYAIYIGNFKVVEFVGDNGGDVSVASIYEVVGDSDCAIDNYLDKDKGFKPFSPEEIVQRALAKVTEILEYDLGKFNCEHFATLIRYGKKYCHQPCEVAATLGADTIGRKIINKKRAQ